MSHTDFDIHTAFESHREYRTETPIIVDSVNADTVRLTDPIYRAIYMSDKHHLDTAFYLHDLENVTLDFGGTTLLLRDETIQPFVIDRCRNVTVRNVTVEYERGWITEIDVARVEANGVLLTPSAQQKKYFPFRVEHGEIIPVSRRYDYPAALTEPHFLNLYDPESGECALMCLVRIGRDLPKIPHEQFPFHYYEVYAEETPEGVWLRGDIPPGIRPGLVSARTHSARDISSCFLLRSEGILLDNVRIINGAGMGILGMYTKDITLSALQYTHDARSQGFVTNAADAVHLVSCSGTIRIEDSVLEGMKDDALNIHNNYYVVTGVDGDTLSAKLPTDIQKNPSVNAHYQMFGAGDRLQFFHGSTMRERCALTLREVTVTDDFHIRLRVDGDTSAIQAGDTIENLSTRPDILIRRTRFGKARTHLRFQSRGKILMEDCDCSLRVLLPGDKQYWYEGSPVRDLTVRNCHFTTDHGRITVHPEHFEATAEEPYYHKNICIHSCSFESPRAITAHRCDGITFLGNVTTNGVPFENEFHDCAHITTDTQSTP